MSAIFLEKAIWGFFALISALIAVIYRLFNGSLVEKAKRQKLEIKSELGQIFEAKFGRAMADLKGELHELTDKVNRFKDHENNNTKHQIELLRSIFDKIGDNKNEKT